MSDEPTANPNAESQPPRQPLPQGWRWVRLGDVCTINPPRPKLERLDNTETTFVPMSAVDGQSGTIAQPETKPFSAVRKGYTYFAEGDVLFAKITPCMENGKHAIAHNLLDGIGFGSTEFHVLRPSTSILADWAHGFIRRGEVLQAASVHFAGAVGQQRVPSDFLASLEIPLPPLSEQERIAGLLQAKLAAVAQARVAAEARLAAAHALPAAYLREVFESEAAQGWPRVRLGDVCIINPPRPKLVRQDDAETTFVPMSAVDGRTGTIARPETKPFSAIRKGYTYFAEGDVLFAKITPCMENGKHSIAHNLLDGIGFGSTEFHVLRPSADILADWVHRFIRRIEVLQAAAERFAGAVGQQRVPESFLASLEIPLPSVEEQQSITKKLNKKTTDIEYMTAKLGEQLAMINQLPATLLRQAFRGEL